MSEYFGTVTQRPVHPASPVLLQTNGALPGLWNHTSSEHFLSLALHLPCRLDLGIAALSSSSRLAPGNSTYLKRTNLAERETQRLRRCLTHTFPHVTADSRCPNGAHCLASGLSNLIHWRSPEPGCVAAHAALQYRYQVYCTVRPHRLQSRASYASRRLVRVD